MSETAESSLTVVLGTRNRLPQLQNCLRSLIGNISVDHEIVVVEAGSTDGTLEYLQGLAGVRVVVDGEVRGQARSLNKVFEGISTKYACWLADDNVMMAGMLDLAVSVLEGRPDIGLVALKLKDMQGPTQVKQYMGAISPSGVLNCNHGVIRTALLRQVGFLDERTYSFDPDLTMKVLLAGYKVAHTKRVAIHHYNDHVASPGAMESDERQARLEAARALYCDKYRDWIAPVPRWRRALYGALRRYIIIPAYRAARRAGLPLESRLGYNERDWANMLYSRYISKLDLWRNRRHPYYLVQSMPPWARRGLAK